MDHIDLCEKKKETVRDSILTYYPGPLMILNTDTCFLTGIENLLKWELPKEIIILCCKLFALNNKKIAILPNLLIFYKSS